MSIGSFRGGIHPSDSKSSTNTKATEIHIPKKVSIPLSQHIGVPCSATVEVGQMVKVGEIIGKAGGFVSSPVHATISGKVTAIQDTPSPLGKMVPSIIIESEGDEEWVSLKKIEDYTLRTPDELKAIITEAGIVGMGGATFPSHVKLSPPANKPIDSVILNGVECEPYLTSDHRLMLENPAEIIEGLRIVMHILGVKRGFIGIEKNKPDAIDKMKMALLGDKQISVHALKTKYPQGGEKMLIKAVLNREVPAGGLPMDIGVVVHNVSTAFAIYEAVVKGRSLVERIVTVSGDGINNPKNIRTRIGTSIRELIDLCGGLKADAVKLISGGPMMGFAIYTMDAPITKGTSGILVLTNRTAARYDKFGPCIRCGACVKACPMGLTPSIMGIVCERGLYQEAKDLNVFDCFECGSCTYVCPSKRPMVQFFKAAKMALKS